MLSRILWLSAAVFALVAGMAVQDRWIFGDSDRTRVSSKSERAVEHRIERAIDRSFDKMQVTDSDGTEIDVPRETKRALADAVGRLVKAETELAVARMSDDSEDELQAVRARRDRARADIDRLKAEIKSFERAAQGENGALRDQIQREIREDVRDSVRDAVRG